MEPDFTGFVTKSGIKCADGRTIKPHAFQKNDGQTVPLVWQHQHNSPENVLGHVILHSSAEGVRGQGFFNETAEGQKAKSLVRHKDITNLSIYANQLLQQGMDVVHGMIREVSLVLSGANPGAVIDNINFAHSDVLDEESAIIFADGTSIELETGQTSPPASGESRKAKPALASLSHSDSEPEPEPASDPDPEPETVEHAAGDQTIQDVVDSMTDDQRNVLFALVGQAMEGSGEATHSDSSSTETEPTQQEGDTQVGRVFDQTDADKNAGTGATLTHSDIEGIFASARKNGSLKGAVEDYCLTHGIDSIDTLFPPDQAVTDTPDFISRRNEWVAGVLGGVKRTPFSRIRSWAADITLIDARAKGYVKGNLKREEFFRISRRVTTPQTVYKKQKLDRDDILDVTEFNMVTWLQTEMRIMLDEELARAILIGDGRDPADTDKIDTDHVRPIYGDDALYTTNVNVDDAAIATSAEAIVDAVVNSMRFYRGSGTPTFYTTRVWLAKLLLIKDTLGRRLYDTPASLASAMGVNAIVPCDPLEELPNLIGVVVNLADYTCGTDRGGEVSMFDQFDIDYNQQKYLMETRMSGALTKYRGALAFVQFTGAGGLLADPTAPTFDPATGIGTIPSVSNVTYVTVDPDDGTESASLSSGAQTAIASGAYVTYRAKPASTFEFSTDSFDWTFRRN